MNAMNPPSHLEEMLRETLRTKAADTTSGLTFDEIRRNARRERRRSGRRTALLAAAAVVVAVGAPTAFLLRLGESPSPAPQPTSTPSTAPTTPTPSPTAEPSAPSALEQVRRGRDIGIPWMSDGVIHVPSGAEQRTPSGPWTTFANYHGGWLLSGAHLVQLDTQGRPHDVAQTGGRIAVSGDQMQTAYLADGTVRVGITTGMGDGESRLPTNSPDETGPVGFVSSGRVVYNGTKGQILLLDPAGGSTSVDGMWRASASTDTGDLIAGETADGDLTVMSATGTSLWTKAHWVAGQFSPDGRYLAAYGSTTGGEHEAVALLDARTGDIVSSTDAAVRALPDVAEPPTGTAWDLDGSLLIPYRDGQTWAVLRLTVGGQLTRATDVFSGNPGDDGLVFAARP
jgi:hypothetical protein